MGGEMYTSIKALDLAYSMKRGMERLTDQKLDLGMRTDSKQLFVSITKGRRTTERRLYIDIRAARDSYKRLDITTIGLISGEETLQMRPVKCL